MGRHYKCFQVGQTDVLDRARVERHRQAVDHQEKAMIRGGEKHKRYTQTCVERPPRSPHLDPSSAEHISGVGGVRKGAGVWRDVCFSFFHSVARRTHREPLAFKASRTTNIKGRLIDSV